MLNNFTCEVSSMSKVCSQCHAAWLWFVLEMCF